MVVESITSTEIELNTLLPLENLFTSSGANSGEVLNTHVLVFFSQEYKAPKKHHQVGNLPQPEMLRRDSRVEMLHLLGVHLYVYYETYTPSKL